MSLKDGGGKSLKGNKSAQLGGAVDIKALLAALTTAGVTLINVTLQNMIAFSGMMDDVMIGSIQQSSAAFTKVQIGLPGVGGPFIAYGDKSPELTLNDDGEVISMEGGDMIVWDPATALLNIMGKLQVRDEARFGNIVIRENQVVAVAPDDGNVEIVPQSNKGYILLNGSVEQNGQGTVRFDKANEFSVDSDANAVVNARGNNNITTERGDITLATDTKAVTEILSIEHSESTRSEIVTTDLATDIVTQVVTEQTIDKDTMTMKETTTIDRVIMLVRKISKKRTTVDDKAATITDITVSVYDPETGITDVQTSTETTLDEDVPNPFDRIPDGVTTHKAVVNTMTPHGLLTGDSVTINGTDSEPSYDGLQTAGQIISTTKFELPADVEFRNASRGRIVIPKTGSISISASDHVRFEIQVPIVFGKDGLSYRPQIEATSQDVLELSARYVQSMDPIVTLKSPSTAFSDSGIAVNYTTNGVQQNGFFGFVNNTENFTWIPSATITRNADGSKSVSGRRGIMELRGVQLEEIIGDPNVNIRTPQGGIYFDSKEPITISPSVNIGTSGSIGQRDGDLVLKSNKDLYFEPVGDVHIPESTRLTFSESTSIMGSANGGLQINSSEAPTTFNSHINVPLGNKVTVGNGSVYGEGNDLVLTAANAVRIPDDIYLQIGDLPNTGFIAHNGILNTKAVSDVNVIAGGNMNMDAAGNVTLTAGTGVTNLNSTQVIMPAKSELMFSSANYISTINEDGLTVHSDNINLDATSSINIPENIPIKFGANSTIASSTTDGGLHINDPNGVFVDQNLTVTGAFTVYGPVSEITSVHTVLTDPIITLGKSTTAEYVKDRGIEFNYGDNKSGFMGFSQEDGRFYLVKEGHNVNEVFTKDVLGDLVLNKVSADIISSSEGFASKSFSGDPYLAVAATYIDLNAAQHVKIPSDIPLEFGDGSTHYIKRSSVDDSLQITAPLVDITNGNLLIGSTNLMNGDDKLTIDNLDELVVNALLTIPERLQFSDAASISTDANGNLVFSTFNGFVFSKPLDFSTDGYTIGQAKVYYDTEQDRLSFANKDGVTPMDLSVTGDIYDARWAGDVIQTAFGGTGKANNWHAKSVIFVDLDSDAFEEDPDKFVYDIQSKRLGLRTNEPTEALTIGDNGNIDFLSDNSGIIFRSGDSYSWRVGKSGNNFSLTGGSPTSTLSSLQSVLTINPNKQIALGIGTDDYFNGLDGNSNAKIIIGSGDIQYVYLDSALRWSTCTYIKSNVNDELIMSSCKSISLTAPNSISVQSNGSYTVEASTVSLLPSGNLTVTSGGNLILDIHGSSTWNSGADINVDANGTLNMTGNTAINFTTDGPFTFTSGGEFTFESGSADMTINTGNNMRLTSGSSMVSTSGLDYRVISARDFYIDSGGDGVINTPTGDITLSTGIDLYLSAVRHIICTAGDNISVTGNRINAISQSVINLTSNQSMTLVSKTYLSLESVSNTNITSTGDLHASTSGTGSIINQSNNNFKLVSRLKTSLTSGTDFVILSGNDLMLSAVAETNITSTTVNLIAKEEYSIAASNISQTSTAGISISNTGDFTSSHTGNVTITVTGESSSTISGMLYENTGAVSRISNGTYTIQSNGYNVQSLTTVLLQSTGDFTTNSLDTLSIASVNSFTISSSASTGLVSSNLDLNIRSLTGIVTSTGKDIVNTAADNITLTSGKVFTVSSATGLQLDGHDGYVAVVGNTFTVASGTTAHITAATDLNLNAGGLVTLSGSLGVNILSTKSVNILGSEVVDINSNSISVISAGSYTIRGGTSSTISCATNLTLSSNMLYIRSTNLTELSGSIVNILATADSEISYGSKLTFSVGGVLNLSANSAVCTVTGNLAATVGDSMLWTIQKSASFITKDAFTVTATSDILQTAGTTHITSAALGVELRSTAGYVQTVAQTNISLLSKDGKLSLETLAGSVAVKSADSITGNAVNDITFVSSNIAFRSVSGYISLDSATKLDLLADTSIMIKSTSNNVNLQGKSLICNFTTGVTVNAGTNMQVNNPVYIVGPISVGDAQNTLTGTASGILEVKTPTQITLQSPHVLIPQRLCFYHDDNNVCSIYQQRTTGNDLQFANLVGDILLQPLQNVVLPDSIHMQFGDSGYIGGTGETMRIVTTTGNIDLSPGSKSVYLSIDTSLNFGNMGAITQTNTKFEIASQMPIVMDTKTVFLPDYTKLVFGDDTRRIESDGDTLFIYSSDLLSLESNTVRVTGNLIVSKRSTFTVESETVFDSGVITVGGGTSRDIVTIAPNVNVESGETDGTKLTISGNDHNLVAGDTISLIDTVPNIDGVYNVASVPSSNEIVIDMTTPPIPAGTVTGGTIRYALVTNPGFDNGIQFNWHKGGVNDTSGARTGFFGFDRSTERFTFIPEATRTTNVYSGAPGDFQMRNVYADGLSIDRLLSSLDANTQVVTGSHFLISGGAVDNTPVGFTTPSTGRFTDLHVEGTFSVGGGGVIKNLNADLLDGYHAEAFVLRDGSTPLTGHWDTGGYRIVTAGLSDTSLAGNGIVTVGEHGRLQTDSTITFVDGVLSVPNIAAFKLMGDIDLNGFSIRNGIVTQSAITNSIMTASSLNDTSIQNSTFSSGLLHTATMTNSNIANTSFIQGTISNSVVDTVTITASQLTDVDVASSRIINSNYKNGTIATTDITNSTVRLSTVQDGIITNNAISGGTVKELDISDVVIANSILRDVTVDIVEITNGVITTSLFKDGSLTNSEFTNGTIVASNLSNSTMDSSSITNGNIVQSTFSDGHISNSTLDTVSLTNGTIVSSVYKDGAITNVDIDSSRVISTNISQSTLEDSILNNNDISNSRYVNGQISQTNLSNVQIIASTADSISITNGNLVTGNIQDYNISNSHYANGNISDTVITASAFINGTLSNSAGSEITLTNSNVSNSVISVSTFQNGNINDTDITQSRVTTTDITQSTISQTHVDDITMVNSEISTSVVTNSDFNSGRLKDNSFTTGSITASTVEDTDIAASRIQTTDITNSTVQETNISNSTVHTSGISASNMTTSTITDSDMTTSRITDSDITASRMVDSDISGSRVTTTVMSDSNVNNTTIDSSSFNNGSISLTNITKSTMDKSDIEESHFTKGTITESTFVRGDVENSNISLEAGKVMDVSRGTIKFANDQIHGDWISGGLADIDISGNSETVTNGVYRRDFAEDHTIMKADEAGEPYSLVVPEETLVGRRTGGLVDALTVENVQEMLDIVQKKWYKDNSILKADTASNPVALEVPPHTIIGRYPGETEKIAALTAEQVIQMIMSTEVLHRYGAMLRDGHRTFPNGGQMTGLIYYSTERFSLTTGQQKALDINVETSYISINYSRAGGRVAKVTLGRGLADGHRKVIIASHVAEKAILQIQCDFIAPEMIDPMVFAVYAAGQSAHLQWDSVLSRWLIVGSGCAVLTRDQLRDPDWIDNLGLDD